MNASDATTTPGSAATQTAPRVGFIGLGSQGGPMARQIVESGITTTLWARRPAGLEPYSDTAAHVADTPFDLGRASDLVSICVVDDAGVEAVLTGDDGVLRGMAPGSAVAIHSTIHPDTCKRVSETAALYGIDVIDAPVSGGGIAASERRLLVMTGGEPEVVDRFRPVFETFASPIVHMGELGAGLNAKLLNNTALAAQLSTAAGILSLGSALGIDPRRLAEVISSGTGASFAMTIVGPQGGDLSVMSDSVGPLLRKDVGILAALLGEHYSPGDIVFRAADHALTELQHPRGAQS